jgi:hypothetical protein
MNFLTVSDRSAEYDFPTEYMMNKSKGGHKGNQEKRHGQNNPSKEKMKLVTR